MLLPKVPAPTSTATRSAAVVLPPVIRVIVHPSPIRVSYPTVAAVVPPLLARYDPDYIVHIGMAGGRDHYTLETCAHRENYRVRDVDNCDGYLAGERRWRIEGFPEKLEGLWHGKDVLSRWREELTDESEKALPDVRLSHDAGRFLCEFIYYESLSVRFQQTRAGLLDAHGNSREGKVCFLHVPGETDEQNLATGAQIAEAAIRSVVGSWEEGMRKKRSNKVAMDFVA